MLKKTTELSGLALDYWVAKCEGHVDDETIIRRLDLDEEGWCISYSTDWAQGGPIIQREGIRLHRGVGGYWWAATDEEPQRPLSAPSPLVAAMRCYVASKLGDEVEIPDELKEN